jgi:N6-L-threonylcarbamoyladenine synthase
MTVLGIETSCDETSCAVVRDGEVLSNVISSQLVHARYGGVVPELASRAHQKLMLEVLDEALAKGGVVRQDLEGVAATYGPGLAGALLVGLSFAKGVSYALRVPFVGVNHMEGHLYSNFLGSEKPGYPFLSLVVSGGHTMLVLVDAPFRYRVLGQTRDDAAGEAFDKVAKMLGLGYPGGPVIDRMAAAGDPSAVRFPRSLLDPEGYEFSFSGIKTSVLYYLKREGILSEDGSRAEIPERHLADICAGFREAVVDVLVRKTLRAAEELGVVDVTVAGGVSANALLRARLREETSRRGLRLFHPNLEYCMDNAAMIAYTGWLKLARGESSPFDLPVVPNLAVTQTA